MPDIDPARLRAGDRRSLARAITLCESSNYADMEKAQLLLDAIMPYTGNSLRIGISGVPGAGKSTFIEAFGLDWVEQGKKVAVLAIDPSSPLVGGSILGDKTRMEELAKLDAAFIRPSPSRGCQGGVAERTREAILLCEAAGFDIIIVETVGVGQSEFDVARMVDFFMVLLLPNAGDELQGIKRGILELADLLIINKCDGPNRAQAQSAKANYQSALRLLRSAAHGSAEVVTCSALLREEIGLIRQRIEDFAKMGQQAGWFQTRRQSQNGEWMRYILQRMLENSLYCHEGVRHRLPELENAVIEGLITPLTAARQLMTILRSD
ncbi:methylmalonyl Co-A mutase-associated GTPase MeaB [Pseudomonas sp. H3(2019)]|uniref:methylmalonyl Co-A mutase-associated GTPase MeaB n=1 Tax=Pseudomonas sp. H3(2019) TaxID=2598724 RepID=UPI00119459E6|nr:methylmalonyl Co-A mutase-associated GTPase MeaB [Pseudomonas sp. H3(2019)]TVT86082.1 methylmalonyl Co-A mutase-associated GTPase MeaB [Pseudomonas sp. H3(2019)]